MITTMVNGKEETRNTAQEGDFVVCLGGFTALAGKLVQFFFFFKYLFLGGRFWD